MKDPVPEIFEKIYERHGHRCPMSTLGGRLGMAAMRHFGSNDGELMAVYTNRTCALDGIAETTGCTEENKNLLVKSDGRHCLTLQSPNGFVSLELTPDALEMAGVYRELCDRLERGWEQLPQEEQARRRAEMDAMLDELLPKFWLADDDFLMRRVVG